MVNADPFSSSADGTKGELDGWRTMSTREGTYIHGLTGLGHGLKLYKEKTTRNKKIKKHS